MSLLTKKGSVGSAAIFAQQSPRKQQWQSEDGWPAGSAMAAEGQPDRDVGAPLTASWAPTDAVPANDTLWSWSRTLWNDPRQWPLVYEGCQKLIGGDPRAISNLFDLRSCSRVPKAGRSRTVMVNTTVKTGDCLWAISRNLTGDPLNWKDLVEANRDYFKDAPVDAPFIDDDLFIIYPGQRLRMPVTAPPPRPSNF